MTNTGAGTLVSFTRTVYDLAGRVRYSMAANGNVTQYSYDAAGRRTNVLVYTNYTVSLSSINQTIAPTGGTNSTQYFYDPNGNQISMIDANGHETDYLYDTANRLVLTTYPVLADGTRHQTAIAYDGSGNKVETTDEAGVHTFYTYDYRGLLTSVLLDSGLLTYEYTYDERGNQLSQSDANGNLTQYQYDALGRRTRRILPDGSAEITAYADVPVATNSSINVQQTSVTDFRGKTIVTTEDVMGRMATRLLPAINAGESNTVETYSYKPGGQRSSVVTTGGGTTARTVSYTYDSLNRLASKIGPEGALNYTWTADSHLQKIVSAIALVASSTQQSPGVSYPVTTSYTYYPGSGRPQPNSSGEVASMTQQWPSGSGMPVSTTSYTYDANGNRTSETTLATVNGVPNTPIVTQYQYDAENRQFSKYHGTV